MAVQKVLLAAPRGFCAGVEMAIKALAWMVRVYEPPVYCYHEIVHNRLVVDATRARFRELWLPGRSDLCFATTNRQDALTAIAARADAIVVIGSANSSNTVALEKVARAAGCRRVHRVNGPDEVPDDLMGIVGVTAGASAPEELVDSVIERLGPVDGVEIVAATDEDEYFPPPRELRDLLVARGVSLAD